MRMHTCAHTHTQTHKYSKKCLIVYCYTRFSKENYVYRIHKKKAEKEFRQCTIQVIPVN